MITHHLLSIHPAKPPQRGAAGLETGRAGGGPGSRGRGRRRHDRQPDHRQCRGRRGRPQPGTGLKRPLPGPGPPPARWCHGVRLARGPALSRRMGGLGQRDGRTGAGLCTTRFWPRTTPIPPTTSRPSSPWPSSAAARSGLCPGPGLRPTKFTSTWSRGSACTSTKSTTSPIWVRPWPPASAPCCLDADTIYQAVQQALHVTCTTRQSRKGEISSWKAYAPAHAGKLAIEAVDRAMRGERSPSPIYEGEDGVIAWLLDGPEAEYRVPLPEPGEPKRAILESYTKEHSAEYQAQALIDLAFRMRNRYPIWKLSNASCCTPATTPIPSSEPGPAIRRRWIRGQP